MKQMQACQRGMSLPVRGAWVEMALHPQHMRGCRSPCGERGLKCLALHERRFERCRSPCGERGLKS